MNVVHVSPTYFHPDSFVGGGERFVEELAREMAQHPGVGAVKMVSFGRQATRERPAPRLERVILRSWTRSKMTPFSPRLFVELHGADVIHCHQYFVLPTFFATLQGRAQGSLVFASDLGGGGWTPAYQIDQSRWLTAHLPISAYAAQKLHGRHRVHTIIPGGVALERLPMRPEASHDGSLVFLGRVLPHKGLHVLVGALPPDRTLHVVGPFSSERYLEDLRQLARGKAVTFHGSLPDGEVVPLLQRAMALVHPTPVDVSGSAGVHELFGLALVEAMACGCPVIASAAASLPEIVTEASGVLVPPNDAGALAAAINDMAADDEHWRLLSSGARSRAESFSWASAADRCVRAYGHYATAPSAVATSRG